MNGELLFRTADIATALARDWEEARSKSATQALVGWAEKGLGNNELARQLTVLNETNGLDADAVLSILIASLDPSSPLRWRGRCLAQTDFVAKGLPGNFSDYELANSILGSAVWKLLASHSGAEWIKQITMRCLERAQVLEIPNLRTANPEQWWWLLATPDALQAAAARIKERFVSSLDRRVAILFGKKQLSESDALRLGAAQPNFLLTVETAWDELTKAAVPIFAGLEKKAKARPCARADLNAVESELERTLGLIRQQRELLRPKQIQLSDPLRLHEATSGVRLALHKAFRAHEEATAQVEEIRMLVKAGHVRRGLAKVSKVERIVAEFTDLSMDFVIEAQVDNEKRSRRLAVVGVVLCGGMIFLAVIIKIIFG